MAAPRDGSRLACQPIFSPNTVVVYDARTGRHIRQFKGHDAPLTAIAFSDDGATLASADGTGRVILRDTATGGRRVVFEVAKKPSCMTLSNAGSAAVAVGRTIHLLPASPTVSPLRHLK